MTTVQQFWKVVQREIQIILHDSDVFILALLAPLFYSLFYGSLYINKFEHDVPIAIVDCDRTPTSRLLIRSLDAHEMLTVACISENIDEATSRLNTFDIQGIVFIPPRFEADIRSGKGATIPLYVNTTRFLVANDITKAVTSVGFTLAAGIRMNASMASGMNSGQARQSLEPLNVDIRPLYNTTESYGDFLTPALLVLVLQQVFFLLLGQTFAKELEEGSLKSLYVVAGRNVWKALVYKTSFYSVLFFSYAFLFFSVHFQLFHIPIRGSILVLLVFTLLYLCTLTLWILFIVSFFKRKILALQVIALTTYPMFLISGYSWPLFSLPALLRLLAYTLPLTPYLAGFSRIAFMGAQLQNILGELLHLVLLMCFSGLAVQYRYRSLFKECE